MDKVKKLQIYCPVCKKWFNSPIMFEDADSFDATTMNENVTSCPYCNHTINCNKENMRMTSESGGHLGNETY